MWGFDGTSYLLERRLLPHPFNDGELLFMISSDALNVNAGGMIRQFADYMKVNSLAESDQDSLKVHQVINQMK